MREGTSSQLFGFLSSSVFNRHELKDLMTDLCAAFEQYCQSSMSWIIEYEKIRR